MPVFKDKNGKGYYYACYYTNNLGERKKKHSKYFEKKSDCAQAEREFLIKSKEITSGVMTVKDFYDVYYITEKIKHLKPNSVYSYKSFFESKFLPCFGKYKLNDVTPIMIRKFIDDLDIAKKTKNTYLGFATNFYDLAFQYGLVNDNPFKRIKREKLVKTTIDEEGNIVDIRNQIWSEKELEEFIPLLHLEYMKFLVVLLYYSGMRLGEALALQVKDIHDCKIEVYKQLEHSTAKLNTPKTTTSNRTIIISKALMSYIDEYKEYLSTFDGYSENTFLMGFNKPLKHSTIEKNFKKATKQYNGKQIKLHGLRHSYASFMISNGYNILFVSKQLGHSNVSTTLNIYTALIGDVENDEKNKMENQKVSMKLVCNKNAKLIKV